MPTPRSLASIVPLLLAVSLVSACGDDGDGGDPAAGDFRVVVQVRDGQDRPVAGLDLALVSDSDLYMDGKTVAPAAGSRDGALSDPYPDPFYPSVIIEFHLDAAGVVRLAIDDIERHEIRSLGEQSREAGAYAWWWNGRTDADEPAPSGVYYGHLVIRDPGTDVVTVEERRPMLLARMNPDSGAIGTTDAAGEIVLADRRLFPHLYDPGDIPATDENGESMGTIVLTPTMRFYLSEPGGPTQRFDREVTGSAILRFTWNPAP
jgi:hypothetical protein